MPGTEMMISLSSAWGQALTGQYVPPILAATVRSLNPSRNIALLEFSLVQRLGLAVERHADPERLAVEVFEEGGNETLFSLLPGPPFLDAVVAEVGDEHRAVLGNGHGDGEF